MILFYFICYNTLIFEPFLQRRMPEPISGLLQDGYFAIFVAQKVGIILCYFVCSTLTTKRKPLGEPRHPITHQPHLNPQCINHEPFNTDTKQDGYFAIFVAQKVVLIHSYFVCYNTLIFEPHPQSLNLYLVYSRTDISRSSWRRKW